jgi:hypothetical protein
VLERTALDFRQKGRDFLKRGQIAIRERFRERRWGGRSFGAPDLSVRRRWRFEPAAFPSIGL